MRDLEKRLKEILLARPSAQLDHRMDQLFAGARTTPRSGLPAWRVPLWACVVACVVCLLAGGAVGSRLLPVEAPEPVVTVAREVYVVLPKGGAGGNVFDWTQHPEPFLGENAAYGAVVHVGGTGGAGQPNGTI